MWYHSAVHPKTLVALLKSMRIKQWPKNGFVLAALVFDRQLFHLPALLHTLAAMVLFCLLSSLVYIYNDLRDIESDRNHPTKRLRPIASGALKQSHAYAALALLALVVFPAAYLLSPAFFVLCVVYVLTNLAYSLYLKHVPILDILVLASFYIIRVGAGLTVISVSLFSPWMFVFTTFLALFMGAGKRRAELALLSEQANSHRRALAGYTLPLLDQWLTISSTLTIMTYSLYTFFAPGMPDNHLMMFTIPFVIFGVFRYQYLVQVEQRGGSPEEILFSDRPLQAAIALEGLAVLGLFYFFYNA